MRKIIDKLPKHFLPVLYFLISVMFYLRTYDSCQIKITLVHIGGTVLITLFLAKIISEFDLSFYKKNFRVILPVFLIIISNVFSHIHSPMKYASGMELIRKSIYFLITLLVIKEFDSEEKINRLVRWLFFACFLATFYGIIQFLDYRFFPPGPTGGLDPFIWRGAFSNRIFSTFGNPNFYGDFLTVMSPIILAIYLKTRKFYLIILWLMTAFNSLYTYSKGAWIGFSVGFITFCLLIIIYFAHFQKGNTRKLVLSIIAAVLIISAGGVGYYSTQRTDSIKFRIYTWLSCWEMINTNPVIGTGIGTFYVTYPAWRRPQIFFIEGRHNTETDHPENEYLEVWFDEGAIGFAIFLWLIILTLKTGFSCLKSFTQLPQENEKVKRKQYTVTDPRAFYMIGFLSAFIGMLSHNFVCVSLRFVSSGVFLWLLIGLIISLGINNPLPVKTDKENSDRKIRFLISVFWIICFYWWKIEFSLALTIGIFIFIISEIVEYKLVDENAPIFQKPALQLSNKITELKKTVSPVLYVMVIVLCFYLSSTFRGFFIADLHHNIAIFHSKRGEWANALANYNTVTRENPGFIMAHYFMGNVFNDRWILNREFHPEWGDKEDDSPFINIDTGKKGRIDPERSILKYMDVWKLAPDYVQSFHQAGVVYMKLGDMAKNLGDTQKSKEYWSKAIELFEKYHKIDPIFPPNYYRLAWIYIQLGDIQKAEETYLRHIYTKYMFKKNMSEYEWVYKEMGIKPENFKECEIHKGIYHCLAWEDWGKRRDNEYSETYVNLGNLMHFYGSQTKAEKYYLKAIELQPENTIALKNLATIYMKTNQKEKAIQLWKKVIEINPQDEDAKKVFQLK